MPEVYKEIYEETVESWCSTLRRTIKITLQTQTKPQGNLITGRPINCSHYKHELLNEEHGLKMQVCNDSARCLLKAEQIQTGRKNK
jgi:hypothetical protein